MGANTRYKDSVFSFLFSDPDILRELYGAIAGVELPANVPVTINTLEGVLYKTLLNDISFEIAKQLVILLEHQSTINPNLPVRLLLYIARVYEKIIAGRNIYGSKKFCIPRPECIVLYNGTAPYPDQVVLKLSDAFEDGVSLGIPKDAVPHLDLTVTVYNINQGHNENLIRRCGKLKEYSVFVAKVRELEMGRLDRKGAMEDAVKWCIAHGILKEFLETHGSEVVNMLLTEWNLEDALAVEREEGIEEGIEKGREENLVETVKNLLDFGMKPEQISRALKLPPDTVQRYLDER